MLLIKAPAMSKLVMVKVLISHTLALLFLKTPSFTFQLRNVLRCPQAFANLLSVPQFSCNNNCYFCFHDNGFCVKDKTSGRMLFQGPIEQGLYPFRSASTSICSTNNPVKLTFFSKSVSSDIWHNCLGHPSTSLRRAILSTISPMPKQVNKVCPSCQLGKSTNLPFSFTTFFPVGLYT